uniref:Odorant receptor n=1 Tax=Glossina brevipalpis TaxID=37001 RepID=A0A1A9W091_9MUSC
MNFGYISKLIREFQLAGTNEDVKCLDELMAYHDDVLLTDVRRVGNIMFYTHVLTAFLFDITPLIIFGVEYIHSGGEKQIDYTLPYGVWYPWDHRQPAMYAFTYAIQLLGSYVAITNFVVPDLILASVASLANLNFGYISKRIREIQPKGNKEDIKCLGELLAYHDDILHMIDEVNDVFSISILLSYFGFSGMSCLIGVNVLTGTHIIEVLKYIVSILSILLIMYYVSKIGTEMITASTDISAALTDHAWYDGNKYYQRMLPFPIARAQRPAVLKGYKFFVLSMESFQSVSLKQYLLLYGRSLSCLPTLF